MAKVISFTDKYDRIIHINPDHVVALRAYDEQLTEVFLPGYHESSSVHGGFATLKGSLNEIATALNLNQ